jgi:hypothetical protein
MFDLNELRQRLDEIYLTPPKRRTANLLVDGYNLERIAVLTKLSSKELMVHVRAIELSLRQRPPSTRFVRFIRNERTPGGSSAPTSPLAPEPPRGFWTGKH